MNVQDMKTRLLSLVETFKEKESELTDLDVPLVMATME